MNKIKEITRGLFSGLMAIPGELFELIEDINNMFRHKLLIYEELAELVGMLIFICFLIWL